MRTKEEIIEGNKLIAEFMGYEKTIYSDVFNGDLYALDVSNGCDCLQMSCPICHG